MAALPRCRRPPAARRGRGAAGGCAWRAASGSRLRRLQHDRQRGTADRPPGPAERTPQTVRRRAGAARGRQLHRQWRHRARTCRGLPRHRRLRRVAQILRGLALLVPPCRDRRIRICAKPSARLSPAHGQHHERGGADATGFLSGDRPGVRRRADHGDDCPRAWQPDCARPPRFISSRIRRCKRSASADIARPSPISAWSGAARSSRCRAPRSGLPSPALVI